MNVTLKEFIEQRSRQKEIELQKTNVPQGPDQEKLQVINHREEILSAILGNIVTIISAVTGSGKVKKTIVDSCFPCLKYQFHENNLKTSFQTTQVPQFLLDDAIKRGNPCRILVSQPRKIAAITVAKRVASERNCELGEEISNQVGLDKKKDEDYKGNRVTFCTTGVILQKIIQEKSLESYTHIILDEIHEREINMDLLVTIVRELLMQDSIGTKIILMSATLNVKLFVDYFSFRFESSAVIPAVIELGTARRFKIDELYLDDLRSVAEINYRWPGITGNVYQIARDIIVEQIKKNPKAILVFLPGITQIEMMYSIVINDSELKDLCVVCVLHSSLSVADQRIAFTPTNKPKIVLSTNIAESSVTIADVSCVIDFCLTKHMVITRESTMGTLQLEWAAKDSLNQRRGRTGRTCDGVVYRLIHKNQFQRTEEFTKPEMERSPLESIILQVKLLNFMSPVQLLSKAMNPPRAAAISIAVMKLKEVGGLSRLNDERKYTHDDGRLTYVGRIMAALPLDIRATKLIVLGYVYSVLDEAITIAAGLTIKNIFRNSFQEKLEDYSQKLMWANGSGSDSIAILNAYYKWMYMSQQGSFKNKESERVWCNSNNLELRSLYEMRTLIREINGRLENLDLKVLPGQLGVFWDATEKPLILKICIAGAFIPNFFIAGESTESVEFDIFKECCGRDPYKTLIYKKFDNQHVGEVYVEQIKSKLIKMGICRSREDMQVTFEKGSSKFFVEFVRDETTVDTEESDQNTFAVVGKIPVEVYKGIKSRKLGDRLCIDSMTAEETFEYAKNFGIEFKDVGIVMRYKNKVPMSCPQACIIPLTYESDVEGVICHIYHCGKFYVQPQYEWNLKLLNEIEDCLDDTIPTLNLAELKDEQLVAVSFNGSLRRAKIVTKIQPESVQCFLFDYGNVITVHFSNVHAAWPEIFEISERCFEAKLVNVEPSAMKCPRGKWTEAAVKLFQDLVKDRKVLLKVHSVVNRIAAVKIVVDDVCVNDALIANEFATEMDENFPRQHNYEMRKKIQSVEELQFNAAEEFNDFPNEMLTPRIPLPPMSSCKYKMNLSGPHSAMESKVSHCFVNSSCSEVVVDSHSANSIVLYDNPANIYGRLMVAADVTKGNNCLIARETTMMPDIPGLAVLLAMIFAPDVVFHRNESKTKYTNVLFGLGSIDGNMAMFSRKDCTLPVHFKLDMEDFDDVNFLRCLMSSLLATDPNQQVPEQFSNERKSEIFRDVKNQIVKILSKVRDPVPTTFASHCNTNWNIGKQDDLKITKDVFHGFFYQHIAFPPLQNEEKKNLEKLARQLEQLEIEVAA